MKEFNFKHNFFQKKSYCLFRFVVFTLFLFFLVFSPNFYSQDRKKLEDKRKKIEQEIEKAAELLKETQKNQEYSMQQLEIISSKIKSREELIQTISSEVSIIDKDIKDKENTIKIMQEELKKLKNEYAHILQTAYKNRGDYQNIMFILSSKDFNQAYKRLKYLQQYSEYRKKQADLIESTRISINNQIGELKKMKEMKLNLLSTENKEKLALSSEKNNKQKTIEKLKEKEKDLKKELKKKNGELAALKKAIEDAIAKEMEEAKKKTLTEQEKKEDLQLMAQFEKNKGKFPWPVEKGIITGRFGKQAHEVLSNVQIDNHGIDITASEGSEAIAIFEGVVTKIITIPNAGKAVLIRHGEYLSVYFQLYNIIVHPGDKISTGQKLGSIITKEDGKTELHFELWKGKTILDPALWLRGIS